MKRLMSMLASLTALACAAPAGAVTIFACEPEWAALAAELAGPDARIVSATTAQQDPHRVQARPSLIARARQADLLVCTGADLEAGWLPLLLRQAGNAAIQPGRPGHFLASEHVRMLEVPVRVDRREGDVHPAGNPHLHLDPRNIARIAEALAERLAGIDPQHAAAHAERHAAFAARWRTAVADWEARAQPLRGLPFVSDHKGWIYLAGWLGLEQVATLEPRPGIPPSAAHLSSLLDGLARTPARLIVRAAYQDARPAQWLSERAGIPIAVLPFTVGGSDQASDLFGLFEDSIARLLEHAL